MIVVDTTVWIDFLEARGTSFDLHLGELIERGEPLALTDLIYCEVLQGILEEGNFRRVRTILRTYPILPMRGLETFEHADLPRLPQTGLYDPQDCRLPNRRYLFGVRSAALP